VDIRWKKSRFKSQASERSLSDPVGGFRSC
jgi:hypothetical protein